MIKRLIKLCLLFIFFVACNKENELNEVRTKNFGETDYYLVDGKKIAITKMDGKFYVMFYLAEEDKFKEELVKAGIKLTREEEITEFSSYSINLIGSGVKKFSHYKTGIIESSYERAKTALSHTLYWAPYYKINNPQEFNGIKEVGVTNLFNVKYKSKTSLAQLEELVKKNGVEMIGPDKFLHGWYMLACTNLSKGNALEMANLFYESGLFENTCPDVFNTGKLL